MQSARFFHEAISPVTNKVIGKLPLATREEILESISNISSQPFRPSTDQVFAFLRRLRDQIHAQRELFFETTYLETGFVARDSREIVDGTIEFLSDFEIFVQQTLCPRKEQAQSIRHSYSGGSTRSMRIIQRPFRCVAAVLPQNAFLTLGIVTIASALYAGSRIVLRPPLQSASTGGLLARAVMESDPPPSSLVIVNSLASDFLEACYASNHVDLIHYIGSNQYAASILTNSFSSGKTCLVDGQGNGMLYLDDTFPLEEAVRIIIAGATGFNGETCTSVNGVLVKDTVYSRLKEALVEGFRNLKVGHPLGQDVQIGPLFNEKLAWDLAKTLRKTPGVRILCGGDIEGAYFTPAVVEGLNLTDGIVRDGFFGPALWIQSIREKTLWNWLDANRFPLSDAILSTDEDIIRSFARNSRAGRIVVNEDPVVESMFEPWGGYPPSGLNPISLWIDKYRQTLQMDGQPQTINGIPIHLDR